MKKLLIIGLATCLLAIALVGCGSSNNNANVNTNGNTGGTEDVTPVAIDVNEVLDAILEQGYIPMPMKFEEEQAKEIFLINPDNVSQYAIAKTGRSPGIGLIVIAEAVQGKADDVLASMEQLLENEVGNAFYPDEQDAAAQAEIMVDGPYVSLFIIAPDFKEEAIQMYKDALTQ